MAAALMGADLRQLRRGLQESAPRIEPATDPLVDP
jgi:hypothetical protein